MHDHYYFGELGSYPCEPSERSHAASCSQQQPVRISFAALLRATRRALRLERSRPAPAPDGEPERGPE